MKPVIERTCRVCGCTDNDCRKCIAKTGSPCHWVGKDLCSACVQMSTMTIYQDIPQFPNKYVIRMHHLADDITTLDINYQYAHESLEQCRDKARRKGFVNVGRQDTDHATILESWI